MTLLIVLTVLAIFLFWKSGEAATNFYKNIFAKNDGTDTIGAFSFLVPSVGKINSGDETFTYSPFTIEDGFFLAKFDKMDRVVNKLEKPADCGNNACLVVCREKNDCLKYLDAAPFDKIDEFIIDWDENSNVIAKGKDRLDLFFKKEGNNVRIFKSNDAIKQEYEAYINSK